MSKDLIDTLLQKHSLISEQVDRAEIKIILRELSHLEAVEGDVVEFGCYAGTTSLFLQRFINMHKLPRVLHVYDSFEGLPPKRGEDVSPSGEQFQAGALFVSKKQYVENFKKAGVPLPRIHKGWFEELSVDAVPEQIAFAFLDGDYYSSIRSSLEHIEPNLAQGAVIVVDDYANEALPGAARAVDEWCRKHPATKLQVEHSLAILRT
jgi:O-methyltransferase